MDRTVNRRQALASLGTLGLGTVLAACGNGGNGGNGGGGVAGDAATTTAAGATSRTAAGGVAGSAASDSSATAGATTSTSAAGPAASASVDAAMFDDAAACTFTPELTEGPYYFDVDSIRSDIREDRAGSTLRLGIRVRDAATCAPRPDAVVDIWHCDALGLYSGFEAASTGRGVAATAVPPTPRPTCAAPR